MPSARTLTTGGGGWRVTGQSPANRRLPNGQFTDGMVVQFTTGSGVHSTVFVPESMYTPDNVRTAITAKARTIDAVAALGESG